MGSDVARKLRVYPLRRVQPGGNSSFGECFQEE